MEWRMKITARPSENGESYLSPESTVRGSQLATWSCIRMAQIWHIGIAKPRILSPNHAEQRIDTTN